MDFKLFSDVGIVTIVFLTGLIAFLCVSIFVLNPVTENFNSILIITMIGAQLVTIGVLLKIYEVLKK